MTEVANMPPKNSLRLVLLHTGLNVVKLHFLNTLSRVKVMALSMSDIPL